MPHVCDDEWHHYAINVNFPEVRDKSPPITRCEYQQHFNLGNDHFKCESNVIFRMQVELIVDGEKWEREIEKKVHNEGSGHHGQDNPEIIDDWPLHPAGDINTKVTIGACWQGQFQSYLVQSCI